MGEVAAAFDAVDVVRCQAGPAREGRLVEAEGRSAVVDGLSQRDGGSGLDVCGVGTVFFGDSPRGVVAHAHDCSSKVRW